MSGRDLFTFNADACVDDEDAEDVEYEKEEADVGFGSIYFTKL